jgi:hypothetical protein
VVASEAVVAIEAVVPADADVAANAAVVVVGIEQLEPSYISEMEDDNNVTVLPPSSYCEYPVPPTHRVTSAWI